MFEVILTNFGTKVYEGSCQESAIAAARLTGFEAVINKDNNLYATFSPIGGWKFY